MKTMTVLALLALLSPPEEPQQGRRRGGGGGRPQQGRGVSVGKDAPNLKLKSPDGKTEVELAKLKGKPVMLIFGSYT